MTRFVFITGGVVSSLGKGISSASLGALLQARGFEVRLRKLDPYLNVDPGTMNPFQHVKFMLPMMGPKRILTWGIMNVLPTQKCVELIMLRQEKFIIM